MVTYHAYAPLVAAVLLVFLLFSAAVASVNVTVDDESGDEVTKVMPAYAPAGVWKLGPLCTECLIKPDPSQAFDSSWHDSTVDFGSYTIEITFIGSAVYAYFILPNNVPGATVHTNMTFSIDRVVVGAFEHQPDADASMQYNVLAYSNSTLSNSSHTFLITSVATTDQSVVLFDRLIYTSEDDSIVIPPHTSTTFTLPLTTDTALPSLSLSDVPSVTDTSNQETSDYASSTSRNAIIGGCVGGGIAVLFISAIALLYVRRRRRQPEEKQADASFTPFITETRQKRTNEKIIPERSVAVDPTVNSITQSKADFLSLRSSRPGSLLVAPSSSVVSGSKGGTVHRPALFVPGRDAVRRDLRNSRAGDLLSQSASASDSSRNRSTGMTKPWRTDTKERISTIVTTSPREQVVVDHTSIVQTESNPPDRHLQGDELEAPPPDYYGGIRPTSN